MNDPFFTMLFTGPLLLAMVALYHVVQAAMAGRKKGPWELLGEVGTGLVLGLIGIGLMSIAFVYAEGIIFDARSVLIGAAGLFFGWVPTVILMLATAAFRLFQGGIAAPFGVGVIVASGLIGLTWRTFRPPGGRRISWLELYLFGWAIHVAMLLILFFIPGGVGLQVVQVLGLPILVFYPPLMVVLGLLLADRDRRERLYRQLDESEARYRSLFDENKSAMLICDARTGRIIKANPAAVRFYGWPEATLRERCVSDLEVAPECEDEGTGCNDRTACALEGDGSFRCRHRSADGSARDVEILGGLISINQMEYRYAIIQDISDRMKAERSLVNAKEAAEAADLAKARFLAVMSHEVRTPLSPIISISDLLLEEEEDPEKRDWLRQIQQSGEHLLALLNDIFDLSNLETGARRLNEEPLDLDSILAQSIDIKIPAASAKNLKLSSRSKGPTSTGVFGDPVRLRQVLLNLIGNAIKFTEKGSVEVSLKAEHEGDGFLSTRFEVKDTGPGIPEPEKEKIFQAFYQAPGFSSKTSEGAGLGLAICRNLVLAMGGEIGLESAHGEGATFWFTLRFRTVEESDREPEFSCDTPSVKKE